MLHGMPAGPESRAYLTSLHPPLKSVPGRVIPHTCQHMVSMCISDDAHGISGMPDCLASHGPTSLPCTVLLIRASARPCLTSVSMLNNMQAILHMDMIIMCMACLIGCPMILSHQQEFHVSPMLFSRQSTRQEHPLNRWACSISCDFCQAHTSLTRSGT